MQQATQTIGFGPEALWITVGVLIAMAAVALMVLNLIKAWREVRKPNMEEQARLRTDTERINDLEVKATTQEKEMTLLLRAQVAMLHHMVDGNNTQALKENQRAIEEYLLTGKFN